MKTFYIRAMRPEEAGEVATLIFESTNAWYEARGLGTIFGGDPEDCLLFPEVYEDLDPGHCLIAEGQDGAGISASCFLHPRETHLSLGIMNARPGREHRGAAKALLAEIIQRAEEAGKPLRLVSSAFNLDSFSLYTRQGLNPYAVFQDLTLTVPEEGFRLDAVKDVSVRPATVADVEAIDRLEREVWATSRKKDWGYFIENARKLWSVSVVDDGRGDLLGALASVSHPASEMLGPGVARDSRTATALLVAELNRRPGKSPVFLLPSDNRELVAFAYEELGARNCELHLAQCLGETPEVRGVVMPTFMPETA